MSIFHRCETCYYAVKTGDDHKYKQFTCPYDGDVMLHHYVDEMSIFTNLEDWIAKGKKGYYSLALGRAVENKQEEEKIMKDRGFIKESDLKQATADDWYDKWWEVENAKEEEIQRLMEIYNNALSEGKTKEEAIAEAFTAEDCLSGHLDNLFKRGETNG